MDKNNIKEGFFIKRPVFATVISIIITFVGLLCIRILPVERYPNLTPPQVSISAVYNGASAETIAQNVASVLESELFGVDNMIYMNSVSSSAGTVKISVTFALGTDPDIAAVNVNNRVQKALAKLPAEVQRQGATVTKQSPTLVLLVALISPDSSKDKIELTNYANLNVLDELKQIHGIGDVQVFGNNTYAMRLWLDPNKLAYYNLTPADVIQSVSSQNSQFAAGTVGDMPVNGEPVDVTWQVLPPARYNNVDEFGEIMLRNNPDGSVLRLKDVARIELGAEGYAVESRYNGSPAANMGIYLAPDANALSVAKAIKAKMNELSKRFPSGIEHRIAYDTTKFIEISIFEVVKTLIEAMVLVFIIVYIFLQSWRATLIPCLAVPVSIIGTFAGMYVFGFSINTLTMFAMVLAIGMVVDDAIIVIENVERLMSMGLNVRQATAQAMNEVTRPVIAVVLVLCSVFIPVAFVGGLAGVMYQQFAITIVISVVISGIVALSFTPALCLALLKEKHTEPIAPLRAFNNVFDKMTSGYIHGVRFSLKHNMLTLLLYIGTLVGVYFVLTQMPTGLVPNEDQGTIIGIGQLPDGASAVRTNEFINSLSDAMQENPYVSNVLTLSGFDMLSGTGNSSKGAAFLDLIPWDERTTDASKAGSIVQAFAIAGAKSPYGYSFAFSPPPIPGMGTTGGFEMWIQNRGNDSVDVFYNKVSQVIAAASKEPALQGVRTSSSIGSPQLQIDVDREKAAAMGVNIADIFSVLSATFGQSYINDFNLYGRSYKVYAQSDFEYRATPKDLEKVYVRSNSGKMVPLASVITYKEISGASIIERFNNFPAIKVIGSNGKGYSSGEAMNKIEEIAYSILSSDYTIGWSGQSYQERQSSGGAGTVLVLALIMVFLILAAQYESWSLPIAVIVSIPFAVLGAGLASYLKNYSNDIYFQVAIVTLVGLAAKNAILIIEFAVDKYREGGISLEDAAITGAKLRFRPIIMTSLAFIFGCIPLALSSGAGAASRNVLGTAVVGGMTFATILLPLFVPFFFKWIMWMSLKLFPPKIENN